MPTRQILTIRNEHTSRLQRWADSLRSIVLGPFNPKDPAIARYFGNGMSTLSGVTVNEQTAMTSSAVWSAVTMIADDIASLPLMLYKRTNDGGKDRFENHPLYRLLHDAPNPEMDTMVWRRVMQTHVLLWQNAYAEIERDSAGRPIAIWPLVPERVMPARQAGQVVYRVSNESSGGEAIIPAEDMIHLIGHSHDGSVGESIVRQARESLGLSLAAEKFGAAFFANGAAIGGVISYKGPRPAELSDKNYREQLETRHQGVDRAHKLLALYNDATYSQSAIPPDQGQFNETRVFQIREVARWFKMPPHKLGDLADATYSNVEQMDAAYMSSCIRPWLVLWQQQLSRKLIAKLERSQQFIEHDTHGFLSVDAAGRAALYTSEFNVGSITPNEIRGYENRDPLAGGDRSFVPLNMMPMDRVDEWITAQIEAKKPAPAPAPAPPTEQQMAAVIETVRTELATHDATIVSEVEKRAQADAARLVAETEAQAAKAAVTSVPAPPTDQQMAAIAETLRREISAHDAAVQGEADKRAAAEAARVTAETDARVARAEVASLTTDRDGLLAQLATNDAALGDLQQRHETALAERTAAALAQARDISAARDAAIADRSAVQQALNDTEVMLGAAERKAQDRETAVAALTVRLDAEQALVSARTTERDALQVQLQAADVLVAELREQAKEYPVVLQKIGRLEAETATAIGARQEAEATAQQTAIDGARLQARLQSLTEAIRDVLVDKVQGILQREIDRARKAQTTPDKLAKWIDTFYPLHDDFCRTALIPAVTAWGVCVGLTDLDAALDRWIARHLDESQQQLRVVTQESDPDAFAAALERVLRRWETERADRTVARWTNERAA